MQEQTESCEGKNKYPQQTSIQDMTGMLPDWNTDFLSAGVPWYDSVETSS